jgi:hypothetical protein
METKPDKPTYADRWRDAINETYTDPREYAAQFLVRDELQDREDELAGIRRVLTKAAECLRNGVPATFTGGELDLVRHLMPAHEVHQSDAKRWVLEVYGIGES